MKTTLKMKLNEMKDKCWKDIIIFLIKKLFTHFQQGCLNDKNNFYIDKYNY